MSAPQPPRPPRPGPPRPGPPRPAPPARPGPRRELAEATPLGTLYLRRLRRAQLGLSLLALVAFAGLVGALPLVLLLVPALAEIDVLGVPLSAAVLLAPPFAAFVALARLYARRADGLDAAFRELVDRE